MEKHNHSPEAAERQLLRDIQELTGRQFVYEDMWCGMVPFDGTLTELQTGPPVAFAELTWREQADVLREFIHWDHYSERARDDEYCIRENIEAGKPSEACLEGTSLGPSVSRNQPKGRPHERQPTCPQDTRQRRQRRRPGPLEARQRQRAVVYGHAGQIVQRRGRTMA